MSAHFDGGEEIVGRRLREVEVLYVDDPTLNLNGADSDDSCPPSPPPTYYLRVRERKEQSKDDDENSNSSVEEKNPWCWRYVNVEKKKMLVWSRRGGRLLRSIPLKDMKSLRIVPDPDSPAIILEILMTSHEREVDCEEGDNRVDILALQARSRRETVLWAKVLQENVEAMTKRLIALENPDEEINVSEVQQLAKLLSHQLSELKRGENEDGDATSDHDGESGAGNTYHAKAAFSR